MYSGPSPEKLAVPQRGSSERSAFCQTGSLAPLPEGRFTVSGSISPFPFLTITKTPSRVSSSTSSCSRESAELMVLAAFMALFLAVSSTFESRASLSNRKSATPRTRSIAPIARAMKRVRRHLIGKCSSPLQGVARPTHGADQLLLTRSVHLSPEVANVDIHHVGGKAELPVPDAREQEIAGEHPARVLGHKLEQLVLAGRQLYLPPIPPHVASGGVDLEVCHTEYLITLSPP